MGRRKIPGVRKTFYITLPLEVYEKLSVLAKEKVMSFASIIQICLLTSWSLASMSKEIEKFDNDPEEKS